MAAPVSGVQGVPPEEFCEIEASVPTGFEHIAREETIEMLNCETVVHRGRIVIRIAVNKATKILALQSIDNANVIIFKKEHIGFEKEEAKDIQKLNDIVPDLNWSLGLLVWSKFIGFEHPVASTPSVKRTELPNGCKLDEKKIPGNSGAVSNKANECEMPHSGSHCTNGSSGQTSVKGERDPTLPSFRTTCHRTGTNHSFQSPAVAAKFGGTIQDYFGWNVDLKNQDIEVVLNIDDEAVSASISLTKSSLHRRNITNFGPTSLRPTIAYNMLRMCKIQPNEVVCDPMCGGGSIPIQAALNWTESVHICGEIHEKAVPRTQNNINDVNSEQVKKNRTPIKLDLCQWDVTKLPLRSNLVDIFIADLPFGKRSGSTFDNRKLYPSALKEMARVCKLGTGRACLLTHDKRCITKTMNILSHLWRRGNVIWVNIGGISAGVYLLHRTKQPVEEIQT